MTDLRVPLRARLLVARRAGERPVAAALRSAIAAIDNAEAVPVSAEPDRVGGVVAGAALGVGASEAPRRELDADTVAGLVRHEVADLLDAATTYDARGKAGAASSARRGAAVLREVLAAAAH